jgi:ORF6N domain
MVGGGIPGFLERCVQCAEVREIQLYGVSISALNQAVKRNIERFPDDFMFQLTREEARTIVASRSRFDRGAVCSWEATASGSRSS